MAALTATTTAQSITTSGPNFGGNTADSRFYLQNRGPSEIFIGPTSDVTAATGVGLPSGAILEYPNPLFGSGYDVWILTASGTSDVRWVML